MDKFLLIPFHSYNLPIGSKSVEIMSKDYAVIDKISYNQLLITFPSSLPENNGVCSNG